MNSIVDIELNRTGESEIEISNAENDIKFLNKVSDSLKIEDSQKVSNTTDKIVEKFIKEQKSHKRIPFIKISSGIAALLVLGLIINRYEMEEKSLIINHKKELAYKQKEILHLEYQLKQQSNSRYSITSNSISNFIGSNNSSIIGTINYNDLYDLKSKDNIIIITDKKTKNVIKIEVQGIVYDLKFKNNKIEYKTVISDQ